MSEVLFWSGQTFYDTLLVLLLLVLLALAFLSARYSHFLKESLQALFLGNEQRYIDELNRLQVPYGGITLAHRVLNALLLSVCAVEAADNFDLFINVSPTIQFACGAACFVLVYALFMLDRFVYYAIGRIYLDVKTMRTWLNTYSLLEWWLPYPVLVAALMMLHTNFFKGGIYLIAAFFLLWRVVLIMKSVGTYSKASNDYFLLFLYLCSREIIPPVFLVGGVLNVIVST